MATRADNTLTLAFHKRLATFSPRVQAIIESLSYNSNRIPDRYKGISKPPRVQKAVRFRFRDLPPEIRNIIYKLALRLADPVQIDARYNFGRGRCARKARLRNSGINTNVLLVNRQINIEATAILYGCNSFHFVGTSHGCATLLKDFLVDIGRSARHLRFVSIGHLYNTKTITSALHLLKQATNLEQLTFRHHCCFNYAKGSRINLLVPWLRSLKKSYKLAGKSVDVRQVLKIDLEPNLLLYPWGESQKPDTRQADARLWVEEQIEALESVLAGVPLRTKFQ
ncbi:hypothetical protein LTR62_002616 [Meristemomyces frigidus]|uniref:Uncharacterized protein n=1 Tax=Meristemomyces frigidus TaxID=1508187 RepID=A0AAN7YS53_9PEZI|nr:hypothetical protein LTR62_002616 [Meristemomyces frigidus]